MVHKFNTRSNRGPCITPNLIITREGSLPDAFDSPSGSHDREDCDAKGDLQIPKEHCYAGAQLVPRSKTMRDRISKT